MSDDRVGADASAQLDTLPPADAWIAVSGDHDGDISITGNEAGLARLSQILLRCALDTPEAREYRLLGAAANDLRGLMARESELSQ